MSDLDTWTDGDKVVRDDEWDVYRIQTKAGVLVGTEYGGLPLGWESREDAVEERDSRQELARDLRWYREQRKCGRL
jgi:hypothetical protein